MSERIMTEAALAGQTVLVTGGAGNLGRAVTHVFLDAGARVAVPLYKTDRMEVLADAKAEFGDRLFTFSLDLTTERGAGEAVTQTLEWSDRLDVVVHLVGGYSGGKLIAETAPGVWERMVDLNLRSSWLVARAAIPVMLQAGRGALVFVSARAAREGRRGHAAYAIAKAGVVVLAETIAEEYGASGLRAYATLPATLDTPDNRRSMPNADPSHWTRTDVLAEQIVRLAGSDPGVPNGAAVPAPRLGSSNQTTTERT